METIEKTKKLVLDYFYSWQKEDFDALRNALHEDVEFNLNGNKIAGADTFVEICKNGIRWEKVDLLDSVFTLEKVALVYDGITEKGEKVRVGEIVTVSDGLITNAVAAIVGEA